MWRIGAYATGSPPWGAWERVELARFLFETESAEWERWFGGEPSRLDPPDGDGRAVGLIE